MLVTGLSFRFQVTFLVALFERDRATVIHNEVAVAALNDLLLHDCALQDLYLVDSVDQRQFSLRCVFDLGLLDPCCQLLAPALAGCLGLAVAAARHGEDIRVGSSTDRVTRLLLGLDKVTDLLCY